MNAASPPRLTLGPIAAAPARYACENWHYLGVMPVGRTFRVGVWEDELFIGTVIFNRGNNRHIGQPYNLPQNEIIQLARVPLREHRTPVSRILRIALKILSRHNPGLRLVISYVFLGAGHTGGIYKASNWAFMGEVESMPEMRIGGRSMPTRTVSVTYGTFSLPWIRANVDPAAEIIRLPPKHVYAKALDPSLQAMLDARKLPYPEPPL